MIEFVLQKYLKMAEETRESIINGRMCGMKLNDIDRAVLAERLALLNQFVFELRNLLYILRLIDSAGKEDKQ